MLTRLLKQKRYFKNIYKKQHGITGLETAIILIAFVVVAAVFAYTVLSAGLFSTQKAQESVYSGLEETQNTIDLKGSVVANGYAMLNNCDYVGWTEGANETIARDTTNKWEGSGALSISVPTDAAANETLAYHAMTDTDFTSGDSLAFWLKSDANFNGKIMFAFGTGIDLQGTVVAQSAAEVTPTTTWAKYTVDLTGDINPAYFGIYLSTDNTSAGSLYLDNVMFTEVASQNGISLVLDSCDYPIGWAESNNSVARDTSEKIEGTGAMAITVAGSEGANDILVHHLMQTKSFADGDVITFWAKGSVAMASQLRFAIAASSTLTTNTENLDFDVTTSWQKYSMTLTSGNDTSAAYYGIYLTAAATSGTLYIDDIEIDNAGLNNNTDPMNSFANTVSFTVSLANAGDGVDFTNTVDANGDGIFDTNDGTLMHKVIIDYNDEYQALNDLAWTATPVGKADTDDILDAGEKFLVTVDLTYVNQNAGLWPTSKIGNNQTFTLEIKPPTGAVLTIERSMPPKVLAINNLN